MTSPVFDFKAIARKLNCQEQKADFEEKNPLPDPNKVVWTPEWGYGVPVPYSPASVNEAARKYLAENGNWEWRVANAPAKLSDWPKGSLSSLAHPEWPYAGTAHEWRGFVKI